MSKPQKKVTPKNRKISWGVYPPARKVTEPSMTVKETTRKPMATAMSSKTPPAKPSVNKASRNLKDKSTFADISKILLRPKGGTVIERKISENTDVPQYGRSSFTKPRGECFQSFKGQTRTSYRIFQSSDETKQGAKLTREESQRYYWLRCSHNELPNLSSGTKKFVRLCRMVIQRKLGLTKICL